MAILAGTKLGPYEILMPLGSGGMGEVYRAKDTRLNRMVAIKVLSSHLSAVSDLRQRFEREARAVSSLNHPNICTLHDVGYQDGIDYLVMELIDGETLSFRLQKGPLSTAELLRYSIQISDALDKAHRHGIIHRDLKPGNIMLTKSGVKLLDFGLAKMAEEKAAGDVSQLATEHRDITREGTIIGTMQYMAPEQLEGKQTDARTDIFAFGAVMYEMASGKKAFEGTSQASLIAAILKEEPKPLSQIQPLTPAILERLVRTCLEKDPEDRWQNAHDVCNQLRWIQESSGSQAAVPATSVQTRMGSKSKWPWLVVAALAVGLIGYEVWKHFETPKASPAPEVRFVIAPDANIAFNGIFAGTPDFAVSHDGTKLVYAASDPTGKIELWVRELASLTAQLIPGTEEATTPFWSPDDRQIAFFSEGAIRKITLPGGTSQVVCAVPEVSFGGDWLPDGTIVFGSLDFGLRRVPSSGGVPQVLTTLDKSQGEIVHSYPLFLPDGRHFLYTSDSKKSENRGVFLGSLDSKTVVRLLDSRYKVNFVTPGFLLFVRGTTLFSQKLQIDPPRLLGEPSPLTGRLSVSSAANNAPITASFNGTILYRGGDTWAKTQLAWFDRNGKHLGKIGSVESDISVRLSPDGRTAAVASTTGPSFRSGAGEEAVNIWNIDLARGVRTRVTFDSATSDENPIWSPDGRFLAFASHRNADRASVVKRGSSGEGEDQLLFSAISNPHPEDWSPDGKYLLIHGNGKRLDISALPLNIENPQPIPFVSSFADDAQGQFAPDGRWVAYTSAESGRNEIYVRPFPQGDEKWQISSAGGSEPRWSRDGKELFYMTPDGTLMSVTVDTGTTFNAAPPVILFKTTTSPIGIGAWGGAAQYDVSRDGSRFLINTIVVPPTPANLYVIVNWHPPG